ncbi:hypothetical protein PFISCL1PPCAC_28039, partial [Pristionchus fissidentatus]
ELASEFEALQKKLDEAKKEIANCSFDGDIGSEEVDPANKNSPGTQKRIEECSNCSGDLYDAVQRATAHHETILQSMQETHGKELTAEKSKAKKALEKATANHKANVKTIKKEYGKEMESERTRYKKVLDRANERHAETVEKLVVEHKKEIEMEKTKSAKAASDHDVLLTSMSLEYGRAMDIERSKYSELLGQFAALQQQLVSREKTIDELKRSHDAKAEEIENYDNFAERTRGLVFPPNHPYSQHYQHGPPHLPHPPHGYPMRPMPNEQFEQKEWKRQKMIAKENQGMMSYI